MRFREGCATAIEAEGFCDAVPRPQARRLRRGAGAKARPRAGAIALDLSAQGGGPFAARGRRSLREAGPIPEEPEALAARLKACPLRLTGVAPIARAISSAGGVAWAGIDERFMLRALPGVFVAGEMIDWEAPTGGYLLQAAFSTGAAAGRGAAAWMEALRRPDARVRDPKAPPGRSKLFPSFFQIYPNFSLGISKLFQTFFLAVLSLFKGLRGAQEPIFYFQAFSPGKTQEIGMASRSHAAGLRIP